MKIKLLIVTCILFLMVGAIIVANTRFWDSKRIEKIDSANITKGDSEKSVVAWLVSSGTSFTRVVNTGGNFQKRQEIKDSKLNPNSLTSVIATASKQGFWPDDLYFTQVYFFFDKQGKLIKYDVLSTYAGI